MKSASVKYNQPFHMVQLLDTNVQVPFRRGADYSLIVRKGDISSVDRLKEIHSHLHYEFFFVLDGELTIVTEKEKQSFSSQIVVIPPYCKHYSFFVGKHAFALAAYSPKEKGKEFSLFSRLSDTEITTSARLSMETKEDFLFYLTKLNGLQMSPINASKINALMRLIFMETNEVFSLEESGVRGVVDEGVVKYIEQIEKFISSHFAGREARIGVLAEILHLSEKQTARIIRREYGCTFPQLINERRLDAACMLLKNTNLSVNEIIEQLNFAEPNYFFALFKKRFGTSPVQYRKMQDK